MEYLKRIFRHFDVKILIITVVLSTIAYLIIDFWYLPELISLGITGTLVLFVFITPLIIIWWLVLIFLNKSNKYLKICLSILAGFCLSFFIAHRQFSRTSNILWDKSGLVTETAIERFKEINGRLPDTVDEIPDSLIKHNNWLVHRNCYEIIIALKNKEYCDYPFNDTIQYELRHRKNLIDFYFWDVKKKKWVSWD